MPIRPLANLVTLLLSVLIATPALAVLPVGDLIHDGPATPEQLSLFVPVTGPLDFSATATVRYRVAGASAWRTGHPLHRIRTDFTNSSGASVPVVDGFAWPIIDLLPGTSYEVEVTLSDESETEVQTETFTTRALPPAAPTATITISAGSTAGQIVSAIESASPGDVVQFEDGVYAVGSMSLTVSGANGNPIYIRGESREGTILSNSTGDRIFHFVGGKSSNLVIENMTLSGNGRDNGVQPGSALQYHSEAQGSENVTIRNLTITGCDTAIKGGDELYGFLVHDNTFVGTNDWDADLYPYGGSGLPEENSPDGTPDIEQNVFWNDAGVQLPGVGHAIFNNSFTAFGDTLSYCSHSGSSSIAECRSIHFYRNDVRESGDDCAEVDYGFRNLSMYDNRCTNSGSFISLDPMYGGPFVAARNIMVNTSRTALKQNATITGQFFYNNTLVLTAHRHTVTAGWWQSNNGSLRAWGFRNNVHIDFGGGRTLWMEATVNDPIDFTHNSWFPDDAFRWNNSGGSFNSLAQALAGLPATQSVFSGSTQRHENDNITESQPFTTSIVLGASYLDQVTGIYTPVLKAGTAPKNSGVVVPNVTDGYSGTAPDRGAIIEGRAAVAYGDRSQGPNTVPNAPTSLMVD